MIKSFAILTMSLLLVILSLAGLMTAMRLKECASVFSDLRNCTTAALYDGQWRCTDHAIGVPRRSADRA